jgi:hypothetical protein
MPLDRRGLLVENDTGESLSLDVLSRGTREAVFIGLRLALLGSFARRGATLPLVLDDVLVNFDTERVRCAAEVLCDFAHQGHQVIMFTCHEHITDIFEDAGGQVRVLPSRDGTTRIRRRRLPAAELPIVESPAAELPPPTPPAVPEMPEPIRSLPPPDPNPLFLMAAADEELFDPVYPLPEVEEIVEKPKRPRKKKPKPEEPAAEPAMPEPPVPELRLPDSWPLAEISLRKPAPPPLQLPDSWPLAELPVARPSAPPVSPAPVAQAPPPPAPVPVAPRKSPPRQVTVPVVPHTFEVLAFRLPSEEMPSAVPMSVIVSPPELTPPAPKHITARQRRERFTWESPEMY